MNYLLRSMTLAIALAASLPALASDPAVATAAAPAATVPAAPADPAAVEAPKPAAAPAAHAAEAKDQPMKVPSGYKVKVVNGETKFCRKDQPLGTRFPTEVCMTQAQYEDQERNRDSMRNSIQDRQKSYSINN